MFYKEPYPLVRIKGVPVSFPYYSFQGVEIVKEDIIEEIAKESGPYRPPEKIQTREEMASSYSSSNREEAAKQPITPNE